jgi:hypothetical protein
VRLVELECASRGRDRPLPGENLARLGSLLEPRRDVDRVTRDEGAAFAGAADHDLSRVHPDPKLERRLEPAQHRKRRVQRALGVVLERGRRAKDGHDGIACEFLHRPACGLDLRRHSVIELVEHDAGAFWVLLAELGRADQVGEEDGGDLPLLRRRGRLRLDRGAAGSTEARTGGQSRSARSAVQRAFTSYTSARPITWVIQSMK